MGGRPDVRTNDRGVNGHGGQAHKYPFSCPPRALAGSLLADPQRERPCTKSSGFKVSTNASRLPRSSLLPMALNQYHQTSNGCLDTLTFSAWYPARPGQCHMYLLSPTQHVEQPSGEEGDSVLPQHSEGCKQGITYQQRGGKRMVGLILTLFPKNRVDS